MATLGVCRWSLNGSDWTTLNAIALLEEGSNADVDESFLEFLTDSGGISRYTEFERGKHEWVFQGSASVLNGFLAMREATIDVPFHFEPGDGGAYYGWRDQWQKPGQIGGNGAGGALYRWAIGFREDIP